MQLAVKHHGLPENCPACVLPKDQFAQREAIWAHALALFADQSGLPVARYARRDLEVMVKAWAQAGAVALMDGRLHREYPPAPARRAVHYERRSYRTALILIAVLATAMFGLCASFWRIFA